MLQSRVISKATFTFVLSERLWLSIEYDFKGFTFQVSYITFATMMIRANNWPEAEILSLIRRSRCATT